MTVEDKRGGFSGDDGARDCFPIGMRVLAVDDDPTCLKVLENLLRSCKYHVTTTNQAVMALKMLRENRDKYDLVISDVNMPDMDGFKLLELVGLEMDLPVIMLSAHSDPKLVMKGISHGAVDYLLKPVRIEELKNIWQHVVRKKKLDPRDQNRSSNADKAYSGTAESGQGAALSGNADPSGKLNRKRKDQDDEEDEDGDDNGRDSDDPSSQKKPRVVWSVELHRKFVAAVNQLGLEKAVPKKILDMMNVEGLTRENVASHLQKYRLYLKRISNVANQQANIVAALGSKDPSFLRIGSFDGFGDFRALAGPGRLATSPLSSYPPSGMLGRLNSPSSLGFRGIPSSGIIQPPHNQPLSGSVNSMGKLQQGTPMASNPSSNLFQGIPTPLELNQLQQNKLVRHVGELNIDASCSSSSVQGVGNNHLFLQGTQQQPQVRGDIGVKSSVRVGSMHSDSIDIGPSGPGLMDQTRVNDNWQGAVQSSNFGSMNHPLPMTDPLNNIQLPPTNGNYPSPAIATSHVRGSHIDFSSPNTVSGSLENNSRQDNNIQCQAGFVGNSVQSSVRYGSHGQRWVDTNQSFKPNQSQNFNGVNSMIPATNSFVSPDISPIGQLGNLGSNVPSGVPQTRADIPSLDNINFLSDQNQTGSHDSFFNGGFEPFDELLNVMIKREPNTSIMMDGDLGFDPYPLGSCI